MTINMRDFTKALLFAVEYSGHIWKSEHKAPSGHYVWPIEEYLVRTKHSPNVAARIRRLNSDGKEEGAMPRGWHPSRLLSLCLLDAVSITDFNKRFGKGAHRELPNPAFVSLGGKRKAVSAMAVAEYRA